MPPAAEVRLSRILPDVPAVRSRRIPNLYCPRATGPEKNPFCRMVGFQRPRLNDSVRPLCKLVIRCLEIVRAA